MSDLREQLDAIINASDAMSVPVYAAAAVVQAYREGKLVPAHEPSEISERLRTEVSIGSGQVSPLRIAAADTIDALAAFQIFDTDKGLSLEYHYDDPTDALEWHGWRVVEESGNINDREWEVLATGKTATEAVTNAAAVIRARGNSE